MIEVHNSDSRAFVATAGTAQVVLQGPPPGWQRRVGYLTLSYGGTGSGRAVVELYDGTNSVPIVIGDLTAVDSDGVATCAYSPEGPLPYLTNGQSIRVRGKSGATVAISWTNSYRSTSDASGDGIS